MRAAFLSITAILITWASVNGQEKSTLPAMEYLAVGFGANEREATRKLNELAAQGWEYVGPLGNSLVAFRRARQPEKAPVFDEPKKEKNRDVAAAVAKLGGTVKRMPRGKKDQFMLWIDLKGTDTTDADLAALGAMPELDDLDLSFTRVTDKGVAGLTGHKALRRLNLLGTRVTDAAIASLRRIPELDSINLGATGVTADGIARLLEGRNGRFDVCALAVGDKARFRVYQVFSEGKPLFNYLMINDTYFGRYYVGDTPDRPGREPPVDRRRLATTYYHRDGPVGQVMSKLDAFKPAGLLDYPSDVRGPASEVGLIAASQSSLVAFPMHFLTGLWSEPPIAVVRLNVGTHAAYGRPYQQLHFYNSTPELKDFSIPPRGQPVSFGYIDDAVKRGCQVEVIGGAERASLVSKAPKGYYRALFVEVTRNDLRDINTDLLTKEAMADMMATLTETGILCFHTSHRYHDLVPPIVDAAASLKLSWKQGNDRHYEGGDVGHFSSEWVMVARKADHLRHLTNVKMQDRHIEWTTPPSTGKNLWREGKAHDLAPLSRIKTP